MGRASDPVRMRGFRAFGRPGQEHFVGARQGAEGNLYLTLVAVGAINGRGPELQVCERGAVSGRCSGSGVWPIIDRNVGESCRAVTVVRRSCA